MSIHRIATLGASITVLTAGALTGSTVGATGQPAPSERAATMVQVSIDRASTVTMPSVVAPGVTTYKISTTKRRAAFQVLSLATGYSVDQAMADGNQGLEKNNIKALKRFEANVTLLGGTGATRDKAGKLVLDLEPGTYYGLETNRFGAPWTPFTVAGVDTGATMPSGATLKAVDSTKWAKEPASIPRSGWLRFKNRADQNHFIILAKLARGKTIDDFDDFIKDESGPPPIDPRFGLDSGALSPGHDMAMKYRLPKGNYVLTCFWPDASMKGMPHAFMGMYRVVTVR
ncbi:hypothetical protein IEZ26_20060 [Nocardioides cavernae]|uniref:Spondin domain-containing protein n=1 Tax=Nocardioides cavernae TaxID=1921566 RepID=A0ABR8NIE1_9ACTN|nr:hypothetical protein [Nocardioides cavernae]MBD3926925.1 hypothetical protein [Nocardioides cavernae]MBM7512645.1 hypothetical protein [Nocardioides cavernae]